MKVCITTSGAEAGDRLGSRFGRSPCFTFVDTESGDVRTEPNAYADGAGGRGCRVPGADWVLIDGPPGTGCAAKSAMSGVDYLVLVAEATVSGVLDVERVIELARHFRIPVGLVVNKSDLSTTQTGRLDAITENHALPRLGSIPFSAEVPRALTRLEPYPLGHADAITVELRTVWHAIRKTFGYAPDFARKGNHVRR